MQDSEFIRGTLPMTKSEVRAVSLSKLDLTPEAVFWDVGSGTGSVAVEAARQLMQMEANAAAKSRVYAIEKESQGMYLIEENRKKCVPGYGQFFLIHGTAPEALNPLPPPTHVFIGGSGGKLQEIVRLVLEKNPQARLVINTITAESLSACLDLVKTFSFALHEIIQVAVTRLEPAGSYHMQKACNPVYIVLLQGGKYGT